jgi:nucleoside-diphosphate-sugar epimerase
MRVLVTGGAGFIGSALVKALVEHGDEVWVLDNFFRGKKSLVPGGVLIYEGDICRFDDVEAATRGVDEVIHLAYINGTKLFYEKPGMVLRVATEGILNLLDACVVNGVRRMMLMSSSEVCRAHVDGMDEAVPLVIPDPFNPRYSYSAGKIISEMMAIHSGLFKWLTIVRPFNIYGPDMSEGHVIPDFRKKLGDAIASYGFKNPIPFEILGNGDETRSFCYIDDFIEGLMLVRKYGAHMQIYNIGTPEEVSIRELARKMGNILGYDLAITDKNELREGSIKRRKPDISKLQKIGYIPTVSLDDGLRRVLCQ